MAEARRLLDATRLLTLTGPGGAGKTRLALGVAIAAEPVAGETWFCDLSSATGPESVWQLAAAALGVDGAGPDLAARFACRPGLLLLDNCEHVLDAAAAIVEGLLDECGSLRVLATSREPLHILGEAVIRLRPLGLPDGAGPEQVATAPAVRLFVERAKAASPGFELTEANAERVVEVCRAMDGLPLALELAAAQLRAMSLETLARSLRDGLRVLVAPARAPERQRTLDATVAWSADLLGEIERRVLTRLSVLTTPFTADTAEAVAAGGPIEAAAVPAALLRLVDCSLLDFDPASGAYAVAETVRAYGRQRLRSAGDAVEVLERAAADADSRHDHWSAVRHLESARELAPADTGVLDRLAWQAECAGHYRLGVDALQALDRLLAGSGRLAERAMVQLRLSNFLPMAQGDLKGAETAVRRALELTRESGDGRRALAVETQLAWSLSYRGDVVSAAEAARSVAARAEAEGDLTVVQHALGVLGWSEFLCGRSEHGSEALERGLALATAAGDPGQAAWFASVPAMADAYQGRLRPGRARLEAAASVGAPPSAVALEASAFLHHLSGSPRALLDEVWDQQGPLAGYQVRGIWILGMAAAAAADLGEAATARTLARRAREVRGAAEFFFYHSWALDWSLGLAAWALGDRAEAATLLRDAAAGLDRMPPMPLAPLVLRDLADLCREEGLEPDADAAESDLARVVAARYPPTRSFRSTCRTAQPGCCTRWPPPPSRSRLRPRWFRPTLWRERCARLGCTPRSSTPPHGATNGTGWS